MPSYSRSDGTLRDACLCLAEGFGGAIIQWRWVDCVKTLIGAEAELFIETGPGKVLCGLLKQIDPAQRSLNVEDSASLERTLAESAGA